MSRDVGVPISELLEVLSDGMSEAEILLAKVLGEISAQISSERIRRGLSQKEFAALMGTTQATISKLESGDQNFTVKKLAELACKLDLDLQIRLTAPKQAARPQPHSNIVKFPGNNWSAAISKDPTWDEELKEM